MIEGGVLLGWYDVVVGGGGSVVGCGLRSGNFDTFFLEPCSNVSRSPQPQPRPTHARVPLGVTALTRHAHAQVDRVLNAWCLHSEWHARFTDESWMDADESLWFTGPNQDNNTRGTDVLSCADQMKWTVLPRYSNLVIIPRPFLARSQLPHDV